MSEWVLSFTAVQTGKANYRPVDRRRFRGRDLTCGDDRAGDVRLLAQAQDRVAAKLPCLLSCRGNHPSPGDEEPAARRDVTDLLVRARGLRRLEEANLLRRGASHTNDRWIEWRDTRMRARNGEREHGEEES